MPPLPVFGPPAGTARGLDLLAAAVMAQSEKPPVETPILPATTLSTPSPYNPAATIPPKVVKKILDLEFVEMAELTTDIWVDDIQATDAAGQQNRHGGNRLPVTDIKL